MTLGKTLINATTNRAKQLHSCPICSGLGEDSLAAISDIAAEKNYNKGEFLMQEGEKSSGFFLVLSGKVRVYKSSPNGKEKVLLIAEPGMTFGEDTLFGEGTFLEMAVALSKTKVLQIPRSHFLKILRTNSDLAFQVMESLTLWIKRLGSSVENVAFHSASEKASRYLVGLTEKTGSSLLSLPAKKKEIADQLGLAPETLSRAFHDFSEREIIKISNRQITILDLDQLKEIANL